MIIYLLVYSFLAICFLGRNNRKLFWVLLSYMATLMIFCEDNVDYRGYVYFYDSINCLEDIFHSQFEVGYMFVCYVLKRMGLEFQDARAVISMFCFVLLARIILKYSCYPTLVLALYYVSPFFPLNIIQIRSFMAGLIAANALCDYINEKCDKKRVVRYILKIVVAITFHSSMAYCLLFVFVKKINDKKQFVYASILGCVGMLFFEKMLALLPFVNQKKYAYVQREVSGFDYRTLFLVVVILTIFYIIFNINKKAKKMDIRIGYFLDNVVKIHILQYVILFLMLIYSFHFYRIIQATFLLDYIAFSNYCYENKTKYNDSMYWTYILVFLICGLLISATNSLSVWMDIFENNRLFNWLLL